MMTKLKKDELEIIHSNNGLSLYLESLLKKSDHTPRSWLYENLSSEEVKGSWLSILSRLENGSQAEQKVFQFDTSQLKKWGPQGGHPPISEAMDVVQQGFGDFSTPKAFSTEEWKAAKLKAMRDLTTGVSLRSASYKHVVDDMRVRDVLESNSGWPLFTRRNKPEVKQRSIEEAESLAYETYPAIALFRYYNQKLRLVWMFPMSTNIVEGSFTQPLQGHLASYNYFAPWQGFDVVRDMIGAAYASGKYVSASDFSSTDAHFRLPTTLECYDVIRHAFQRRYWDGLGNSLTHMHSIPLVIGPDSMLTGQHGVASGSNWTNLIETIFDYIFSQFVEAETGTRGLCGIGDDMAWISDNYNEGFANQLERIGESVGQDVKAEKTTNDRDSVKFLQRLFQRGYNRPDGRIRGVYSTVRALKSSLFPERFHKPQLWSKDMFCARQYMILENCVDHPLFEDFVKFVCNGSPYLVPFAKKAAPELRRITRESKLLPGLNPTYNQEKRDQSLETFASIRIAASL